MLRYSQEARLSAYEEITRLVDVVNRIPGDKLSYIDAQRITKCLCELRDEIQKEYYHYAEKKVYPYGKEK